MDEEVSRISPTHLSSAGKRSFETANKIQQEIDTRYFITFNYFVIKTFSIWETQNYIEIHREYCQQVETFFKIFVQVVRSQRQPPYFVHAFRKSTKLAIELTVSILVQLKTKQSLSAFGITTSRPILRTAKCYTEVNPQKTLQLDGYKLALLDSLLRPTVRSISGSSRSWTRLHSWCC